MYDAVSRLVFKRDELLYDIRNCSFVEGDIIPGDDEHAKHQVFDVGEAGNVDRVTRVLNLAHSECVEMLFPYTKVDVVDSGSAEMDDVLSAPDEYVVVMRLPNGFSQTTLYLLKHLIHEYMVCRVLEDWMSITNPGSKAKWEEKMVSLKHRIQTSLVSRGGRIRRKMKPF